MSSNPQTVSPFIKRSLVIHDSDSESDDDPKETPNPSEIKSEAIEKNHKPHPKELLAPNPIKDRTTSSKHSSQKPEKKASEMVKIELNVKTSHSNAKSSTSITYRVQQKTALAKKPTAPQAPKPSAQTKNISLNKKRPGPPTNAATAKKLKEELYSESSMSYSSYSSNDSASASYSESSFGSDDPEPDKKPLHAKKVVAKVKVAQKKALAVKNTMTINFKDKDHLIDEILCRWWYVLPTWPPENYDYIPALRTRKLTLAEEAVSGDYKKVTQLDGYPGVFVDSENELHDLRPKESCPCKSNLEKKSVNELAELLKKCYEKQLKQLKEWSKGGKAVSEIVNSVTQRLKKLCNTCSLQQN